MKNSIIHFGAYPPGYGGVSIHVKRLCDFLIENKYENFVVDFTETKKDLDFVINSFEKIKVLKLLAKNFGCILHFHLSSPLPIKICLKIFVLSFFFNIIISFHDENFYKDICFNGMMRKSLIRFFFINCKCFIVNSNKNLNNAKKFLKIKKIKKIPGFIAPTIIPEIKNPEILLFKEKFDFLVSSYSHSLDFFNEQDAYGIDLIINALNILVNERKINIGVIILLHNKKQNYKYYEFLMEEIRKNKLDDHVFFCEEIFEEASSLWNISDIIIRATNTDGNSISIKEALHLKKVVIASDCTERDKNVILFKNRDSLDLAEKILLTIKSLKNDERSFFYENSISNEYNFLNIYEEISNEK